ncbi:MAG: restriction endonuclease [Flavobacterium sp. BFFFF2]|nr:MAG: restriction endonuclease [Flavobacterium sp. BFFFF2]
MNPREYEVNVAEFYKSQGYETELTPLSGDYGVDVFAKKGKEKIAIQAKMYGSSTRKINRQTIMELHGAKDFFDCTRAILVTDGTLLPDAITVAEKLKIEIVYFDGISANNPLMFYSYELTFEKIWEDYIIPLQGKVLTRSNGDTNQIKKADWSGIERLTSNGKPGKIKIEIFKQTVNKLLKDGFITRDEINQNYTGRASSGVMLILSQVPFFKISENPLGLKNTK